MPKRKIKRKQGEGIALFGPATVRVSRSVTLMIEAPREARVARLVKRGQVKRPSQRSKSAPPRATTPDRERNQCPNQQVPAHQD